MHTPPHLQPTLGQHTALLPLPYLYPTVQTANLDFGTMSTLGVGVGSGLGSGGSGATGAGGVVASSVTGNVGLPAHNSGQRIINPYHNNVIMPNVIPNLTNSPTHPSVTGGNMRASAGRNSDLNSVDRNGRSYPSFLHQEYSWDTNTPYDSKTLQAGKLIQTFVLQIIIDHV